MISHCSDYVRLYAFLSQILTFTDADLEKLYVFARLLRRYLPPEGDDLPREIQQNIDMESYRVQQTWKGKIKLERGNGEVEPIGTKAVHGPAPDEIEPPSQIIRELNERFGTDFTDEDKVFIQNLEQKLAAGQFIEFYPGGIRRISGMRSKWGSVERISLIPLLIIVAA